MPLKRAVAAPQKDTTSWPVFPESHLLFCPLTLLFRPLTTAAAAPRDSSVIAQRGIAPWLERRTRD